MFKYSDFSGQTFHVETPCTLCLRVSRGIVLDRWHCVCLAACAERLRFCRTYKECFRHRTISQHYSKHSADAKSQSNPTHGAFGSSLLALCPFPPPLKRLPKPPNCIPIENALFVRLLPPPPPELCLCPLSPPDVNARRPTKPCPARPKEEERSGLACTANALV